MEEQLTISRKAEIQNERELVHSRKILSVRIVFCLIFALLATVGMVTGGTDSIWFTVPLAGVALIFFLLALDIWEHCREVSARRWTTLTPRFSHRETSPPVDQGTAQPAANAGAS